MRVVWLASCLFLIVSLSVMADSTDTNDSILPQEAEIKILNSAPIDIIPASIDTIYYEPREAVSKVGQVSNPINYEKYLTQRPTIALFKSMFVPGWGQFGNKKYLKAGLVVGLELLLLKNAIHFGRLASDEWDNYEAELDPLVKDRYYAKYQDQKTVRNKYRWFAGIAIFAAMFDAYVDAHLSGAPDQLKENDFNFDIEPNMSGGFSANLSLSF